MIYFDNNATTMMAPDTIRAMIKWCNKGNPSSSYASAVETRQMMQNFRVKIGTLSGISTCCVEQRDDPQAARGEYAIVITSGASESNSSAITSITTAYRSIAGITPHIIVSAVEHKSIMLAAEAMEKRGEITVEYLAPLPSGHISPSSVAAALRKRPDTALVCIMHANNESGAINDVKKISAICAAYKVPFHCDVVQTWGRHPDTFNLSWCDSWAVSFHKVNGPPGVGIWAIRTNLLYAYNLESIVFGTQNGGLRGGTENVPGIGAALAAINQLNYSSQVRVHVRTLRARLMGLLGKAFNTMLFVDYIDTPARKLQSWTGIVWISGDSSNTSYLGGTILLSVVRPAREPAVCNTEMKNQLADAGVVVSVGSACNTSNKKASHVLYAMGCDDVIRRGTIRISLACQNTAEEVDKFVAIFTDIINRQLTKQ